MRITLSPAGTLHYKNANGRFIKIKGNKYLCYFFRLLDYVSKLKPFQLPVDGAVEAIQTLLKENSPRLLDIIESNSQNLEKCEKLVEDSKAVCQLVEAMKRSIEQHEGQVCRNIIFTQSAQQSTLTV